MSSLNTTYVYLEKHVLCFFFHYIQIERKTWVPRVIFNLLFPSDCSVSCVLWICSLFDFLICTRWRSFSDFQKAVFFLTVFTTYKSI